MLRALVIFLFFSFSSSVWAQDNFDEVQNKVDEIRESGPDLSSLVEDTLKAVEALSENKTIRESLDVLENLPTTSLGDVPWKEDLERLNSESQLLVFVSFSMDDELIRDYMLEASRFGARVVVRGIEGGDMGKAMVHMQRLLSSVEDGRSVEGISIDPRGFDLHDIKLVPTIVLSEKSYELCVEDPCLDVGKIDKITGAVSLKYALEQFSDRGDNRSIARGKL